MSYVLGLDFGTSFTAAVARSRGASRVITLGNRAGAVPSALFIRPDGTFLFGEDAYLRGGGEPSRLVRNLKRRLGDPAPVVVAGHSFTAEELVSAYLRWVLDRVEDREGGPPQRTLLTHPANWRSLRLDAFRRAIDLAGLGEVAFATEPYAAAAFHASEHTLASGDVVAAYDLGGGTFDAAVLRRTDDGFELVGDPEGIEHLGGVDFDDTLFHLVQGKLGARWSDAARRGGAAFETAAAGLRRECVSAKETLSTEDEVDVPVVLPGVSVPVRVTRRELESLIRPAVTETVGAFRRALRNASVDAGGLAAVLLVGGSSRLPLVQSSVADAVGSGVTILDADPKHAVARGAALLAEHPPAGAASTAGTAGPTTASAAPEPAPVAAAAAATPALEPGSGPSVPAALVPAGPPPGGASEPPPGPGGGDPPPAGAAPAAAGGGGSRRRRAPLVAAAAVLAVAVVAAGALLATRDGNNGTTTAAGTDDVAASGSDGHSNHGGGAESRDEPVTTTTATVRVASADRMVEIPAGSYPLGAELAGGEVAPPRTVEVASFHIDVFEVSSAEYLQFVNAQGAPPPSSWPRTGMPAEQADHPVRGVEWSWAQAFCISLGKRLPSEAEWEAAARGPAGLLFPWGDDPTVVDLDAPGGHAVGAFPANVSVFGVRDTVGSAWEWVDEPYEAVPGAQKVRRGGEYGRVRGGAAMRQAVEPTNRSAVHETGFRCAADAVDPSLPPLQFSDHKDHDHEPTTTATSPPPAVGPGGLLVSEQFEDPTSGWTERTDASGRIGYHAPSWYHLEPADAGFEIVSMAGFSYADAKIETAVHVDRTATPTGRFRYGLVFRAHGPLRSPMTGPGNLRPENIYAFVIDPRGGEWLLLHEDSLPLRRVAGGPLPPGVNGFDVNAPDVLSVDMRGDILTMFINGVPVGAIDARGYHREGDVGFYVESLDDPRPHIHFHWLTVTAL